MEPSVYIPRYLEREYLRSHPNLTPAARQLVHEEIATRPKSFITDDHGLALLSYAQVRNALIHRLETAEDLLEDEFEQERMAAFRDARIASAQIYDTDPRCIDARLLEIMIAEAPVENCVNDALILERNAKRLIKHVVPGFDEDAPHFWNEDFLATSGEDAATCTAATPELIGWLHTLEALAFLCIATARYSAAAGFARTAMRAQGYDGYPQGSLLLALARLEQEDEFFKYADESPWYLLSRALLLYKIDRERAAKRAIQEFARTCEGGAYFLLNPTYLNPYVPTRPLETVAWKRTHQAVWEADTILSDVPEFSAWAEEVEGVLAAAEDFARKQGL
ncbi:hypothetical protein K6V98_03605 [Collinsella sp. AGMB00827]|uniref:Tetratricopeptide repeat protein n=1 Tax=Collinsella ureilytica TaxID=2869515 RepID=A0ABS7MJF0_9ACTN|nr:hypothetical protein [Collinsella urealyticum]MBY4797443.1 hypothetical protein [Collinsella urealyticum]